MPAQANSPPLQQPTVEAAQPREAALPNAEEAANNNGLHQPRAVSSYCLQDEPSINFVKMENDIVFVGSWENSEALTEKF